MPGTLSCLMGARTNWAPIFVGEFWKHSPKPPSVPCSAWLGLVAACLRRLRKAVVAFGQTDAALTQLRHRRYSMMQFAKERFRSGQDSYEMRRSANGSIRGTVALRGTVVENKKDKGKKGKKGLDWSWSELANLVKFSRDVIQVSLLKFDDQTEEGKLHNKLALECYQDTMRFMGDYPAKGKTEVDIVHKLLLTGIKSVPSPPGLTRPVYAALGCVLVRRQRDGALLLVALVKSWRCVNLTLGWGGGFHAVLMRGCSDQVPDAEGRDLLPPRQADHQQPLGPRRFVRAWLASHGHHHCVPPTVRLLREVPPGVSPGTSSARPSPRSSPTNTRCLLSLERDSAEWLCLISLLRCWCAVADFGGGPQGTALDNKREFQDQGIICLRNLKQTMKFGGRRMLPDMNEISAILSGKYTKIQKLWVPSPAH